jgi:opacity protein-like surface antigen
MQVGRDLYLGVSAGSWMYAAGLGSAYNDGADQLLDAVATAVVTTAFVQTYPVSAVPFFVRAGLGYANTATYTPAPVFATPAPLIEDRHDRFALTAGAGIDIPLRQHFAVTVSVDYTRLTGTATGFEPTAAVQIGLGLTVR